MPTFDEMVGLQVDKAMGAPSKKGGPPMDDKEEATGEEEALSAEEKKILEAVKSGSAALKAAVKSAC